MFAKWSRQPIWLIVLFFAIAALIELRAPYYRSTTKTANRTIAVPLSISEQTEGPLPSSVVITSERSGLTAEKSESP